MPGRIQFAASRPRDDQHFGTSAGLLAPVHPTPVPSRPQTVACYGFVPVTVAGLLRHLTGFP